MNITKKMKIYDIIVAGGGFAGTCAAIAAARRGKKVLLVERYNALGGAAVYDLVNPFMKYFTWDSDRRMILLSDGIFTEIREKMTELGGMRQGDFHNFNEEYLKLVLNRMCIEAGVNLLFNTVITGASAENGKISTVTVYNVSGTSELGAKYFIDCTGDGNLAELAGFGFNVGRETDSLCQPMTLCFRISGTDAETINANRGEINRIYRELQEKGEITNPREDVLIFRTLVNGIIHFNTTRIVKLDPTDGESVTKAEIEAREQVFEIVRMLKNNFECFKNIELISTGIQIGARESRMIDGIYRLEKEEICGFAKFPDGVCACNYDIDIHSPDGSGTSHWLFPEGEYYTIPYRCLVPKKSKNILVAGRCISVSHEVQASIRIMPVCASMGEAAGTAAALALETGVDVGNVNTVLLRKSLAEAGAFVG